MSEEKIIYRIQHLRGTKEDWDAPINNSEDKSYGNTVIPLAGELAIEIDESGLNLHRLKIGDNKHTYDELPYISADNFVLPNRIKLTLPNNWTEVYENDDPSQNVLYYYQDITDEFKSNDGTKMFTSNSRVDLYNTSAEQLIYFKENNLVFQAENADGRIKVLCLEDKPNSEIELWCTITELIDSQSNNIIYGNIVGVPASGGSSSGSETTSYNYDKLYNKPILVGRKHIDNGEVFNTSDAKDYPPKDGGKINNTAMGEYTASFGHGSRSGIKGYKITEITISGDAKTANIKINGTLLEKWQPDDLVYIDCDIHSMGIYKINAINNEEGNSYIIISHPEGENIDSRLKKSAEDTDGMENWIWNPNYPDDGEVVIRSNTAFSSGDNTHVVGYGAAGFGRDNKVYGDYGFAGGRDNTVNYAGTAFGRGNLATGECATALNNKTKALGTASFASGYNTEAKATYSSAHNWNTKANQQASAAFGKYTTADRESQMAVGVYNEPDGTALFVVGNGSESKKQNAFVVKDTGTAELQAQGIIGNSVVIKDTLDKEITKINNTIDTDIKEQIKTLDNKVTEDITNQINTLSEKIDNDISTTTQDLTTYIDNKIPIVSENKPDLADGQVWLQPAVMADYPIYIGQSKISGWTWYIEVRRSGRVDLKGIKDTAVSVATDGWTGTSKENIKGYYYSVGGCTFPKGPGGIQLPGRIVSLNAGFIATEGNCWYWTERVQSDSISGSYLGRFTTAKVSGNPSLDIMGYITESQLTTLLKNI